MNRLPLIAQILFELQDTYRVYVLRNAKGSFYTGFSENVLIRVTQHNSGLTRSTSGKGLWELVWQSEPMSVGMARNLERELKRQKEATVFIREPA